MPQPFNRTMSARIRTRYHDLAHLRIPDSTILVTLTGIYTATLVIANVTAGKLFAFGNASISAGAFAYIVCLATSDIVVDVYGPSAGYRLVRLATVVNVLALAFGQLALRLPPVAAQSEFQMQFAAVFGASAAVILASIVGFPITDTFETFFWKRVKDWTQGRHLWFRNAAVKIPGQLLDATVFFSLAFFILPQILYGRTLAEGTGWWSIMAGAWIYGLWKGVLGTLNYPLLRAIIPWIRSHREPDIPRLAAGADREAWQGRW